VSTSYIQQGEFNGSYFESQSCLKTDLGQERKFLPGLIWCFWTFFLYIIVWVDKLVF